MILLNVLYGLIIALFACLGWAIFNEMLMFNTRLFFIVWSMWTIAHCVYDTIAHLSVKFFNRNQVYRG